MNSVCNSFQLEVETNVVYIEVQLDANKLNLSIDTVMHILKLTGRLEGPRLDNSKWNFISG